MAWRIQGNKYLLNTTISVELGKMLDKKREEEGVNRSYVVEQALRRYYNLEPDKKPNSSY